MSSTQTGINAAGKRAIRSALSGVEDNLYRFKHFAKPTDRTGNGELVSDVIQGLERERQDLIAALGER